MRDLPPLGVWAFLDDLPAAEAGEFAARVEALGYSALWIPETTGRDPFAVLAHLGDATRSLTFATGIASIFNRHPVAMHEAAMTLAELTGGRFVLGVGVSHAPAVEGLRKLDYSKPLSQMRQYLAAMDESPYTGPPPPEPPPRLLAALGPKMLALSAEAADGAHPYFTTPEHTAQAREIIGPEKLLCVEQKVILTTDHAAGLAAARAQVERYAALPNYRNNWLRLGFSDHDIESGAESFVAAVVVWGDVDRIRGRLDEHLQAGADHVCIQALPAAGGRRPDIAALQALAHPV
jgi:probable F420-dependent oxidoreductase